MGKQINIIGIDPSIVTTGICRLEDGKLIDYATIKAPAGERLSVRLNVMAERVKKFIAPHVDVGWRGVIEVADGFGYTRSKNTNQRSLHKLQLATGAIIRACGECGLILDNFTPDQWKGRTPKEITLQSVNLEYSLNLKKKDNHIADAIYLATWYLGKLRLGRMVKG